MTSPVFLWVWLGIPTSTSALNPPAQPAIQGQGTKCHRFHESHCGFIFCRDLKTCWSSKSQHQFQRSASLKVTVTIQLSKIFFHKFNANVSVWKLWKYMLYGLLHWKRCQQTFKGREVYNCFLSNAFSNGIHSGKRLELTKTLLKTVMERDREMEKDRPEESETHYPEWERHTRREKGIWAERQVGEGNGVRWSFIWQLLFVVSYCCRSIDRDCSAAGPVAQDKPQSWLQVQHLRTADLHFSNQKYSLGSSNTRFSPTSQAKTRTTNLK